MSKKVEIKKTKFNGIDQNPSLLGFGCMRFPTLTKDKPDIDEELAQKMIDYAYDHGVTYFDTAYPYHNGLSELFIGKALKKYPRASFNLASKMPSWLIKSKEDAQKYFYEQLTKCQVEYFDYYLCHALSKEQFKPYLLPGVMDFLYQMKKEGKIRHLGFSFHDTPEVLDEIIHTFKWDFVQLQINYLDWDFINAKKMYEIVENYGVPCIVMEPVRGGALANLCDESQKIFKASKPDKSIASWAIRYAASLPNVLTVLSGMSNMEQTIDNVDTLTDFKPVNDADQKVIDHALAVFLESQTIPCTTCGYCMPCPYGVNIPQNFTVFNQFSISKWKDRFIREYEQTLNDSNAELCVSCGLCLELCPQHIEIPDRMSDIRNLIVDLKNK